MRHIPQNYLIIVPIVLPGTVHKDFTYLDLEYLKFSVHPYPRYFATTDGYSGRKLDLEAGRFDCFVVDRFNGKVTC